VDLLLASESEVDFLDQGNDGVRPGAKFFCGLSDGFNGLWINCWRCVNLADALSKFEFNIQEIKCGILRKVQPELGTIGNAILINSLFNKRGDAKKRLETNQRGFNLPSFPIHELSFIGNDHQKFGHCFTLLD
jgi:hypothetical protein